MNEINESESARGAPILTNLVAVDEAAAADGRTYRVGRIESDGTLTEWLAVCPNDGGWLCRWFVWPCGGFDYVELPYPPPKANGKQATEKAKPEKLTIEEAETIISEQVADGISLTQLQQLCAKFHIGPITAKHAMRNLIDRGEWEQSQREHGGFAFRRVGELS